MIKDLTDMYRTTGQVPYVVSTLIPFHAMAMVAIIASVWSWSAWYPVMFIVGYLIFGGIGGAIMLHRYSAHQSFAVRPKAKRTLFVISCLAAQGSPIWWAALHRGYHHAHSDGSKDLHSPSKGFWRAYMGWMFDVQHNTVNLKYAGKLLRDQDALWCHKNYNKIIWTWIALLAIIDPFVCAWFYIIPTLVSLHKDSLVNSFCHMERYGYANFKTGDHSRNIPLLGLLGWGQGWHNNHHNQPKSFDFGTSVSGKRTEMDPCLFLLPIVAPNSETTRIWNERGPHGLDRNSHHNR